MLKKNVVACCSIGGIAQSVGSIGVAIRDLAPYSLASMLAVEELVSRSR